MRLLFAYAGMAVLLVAATPSCGSEEQLPPRADFDGGSSGTDGSPAIVGPLGDSGPTELGDIDAVITTDNAFSFGYGDVNTISTFIAGGPASGGAEIFDCPVGFGPHAFVVPAKDAPASAYVYIVAWADSQTTQGVLAQFKRSGGAPLYSGSGSWEVCATGNNIDITGPGPDQTVVNQNVAQCNLGATGATYSKGWVTTAGAKTPGAIGKLAFGETNEDGGGSFPIVCQVDDAGVSGIDPQAKWMWFDPEDGQSPFEGNSGNRTKTFLIFRLPASALTVK